MRHFFYTLFFALIVFVGQAQDDIDDYDAAIERRRVHTDFKESLFSIRFSTTLPAPVSNAVLRTKFRGIYEMNFSFNMRLANNFFAGFGFKDGLLGVDGNVPNPKTNLALNTKMQMYTGYLKVGFNKYHNENVFSTFACNIGYNSSFFTNVVNINSPVIDKTFASVLVEPEYSINFAVEDNFSIGIFVSYNYMPTSFNPANIAFQDVTSIAGLKTSGSTGIINFGFGFYYGMGKRFSRRNK
jgi:hypothetical protein